MMISKSASCTFIWSWQEVSARSRLYCCLHTCGTLASGRRTLSCCFSWHLLAEQHTNFQPLGFCDGQLMWKGVIKLLNFTLKAVTAKARCFNFIWEDNSSFLFWEILPPRIPHPVENFERELIHTIRTNTHKHTHTLICTFSSTLSSTLLTEHEWVRCRLGFPSGSSVLWVVRIQPETPKEMLPQICFPPSRVILGGPISRV